MRLSDNALKVLERRYLSRDEEGRLIESAEGLFRRVAHHVAQVDAYYDPSADVNSLEEDFYELMTQLEFMPNSPTLMNAGKPLGQLSACFVLPVPDSMGEIFDSVRNAALIHKSGGGTGFSFSRLRPSGAPVRSTGGIASGPISFMRVFNAATEAVKQGGTRRGANMGILRVDHPDILEFIACKKNNADITNFNISVGLTESFMRAVEGNRAYNLIDPRTKAVSKTLEAKAVYDLIVDMAWKNGEPGIIFLDRLNRDNIVPSLGEIESTNPCGEQPLLPYESCNLGSINLAAVVEKDGDRMIVNYAKLARVINLAVRFLDNVIDVNRYPLAEIEDMTRKTRKIGLGVMGFADMLFMLGIPYNSDQGVQMARKTMRFIQERAKQASAELAAQRGAFPAYEESTLAISGPPVRNGTVTTIAPTGTISIICGASSGIEPLFALAFVRNVMDNDALPEVHPYFLQKAREQGFYTPELMHEIAQKGSLHGVEGVPDDIRRVFVTAHDISPEYHVRMQAAFQEFTDNAVSKTVNFPNSATREDVARVYWLAYTLGCKGATIYRDGSRDVQVLNIGEGKAAAPAQEDAADKTVAALEEKCAADEPPVPEAKDPAKAPPQPKSVPERPAAVSKPEKLVPRPRPDVTRGITERVRIGCGTLYVTVNYDDQGICEVFTNLGRAGGCPSQSEATARLISIALRSGVDAMSIVRQLRGIRCHSTLRRGNHLKVLSCPDAIARVIEKVLELDDYKQVMAIDADPAQAPAANPAQTPSNPPATDPARAIENPAPAAPLKPAGPQCPECAGELEHEGGCVLCRGCGYSKCG